MRRRRIGLDEWRLWLASDRIAITIVVGGDVEAQRIAQLSPVARLEGENTLIIQRRVAVRADNRGARRRRDNEPRSNLRAGGRTHWPGYCGPNRVARRGSPQNAGIRLQVEAVVRVVLEAGAEREAQAIRHQRYLILQKRAEATYSGTLRSKRESHTSGNPVPFKAIANAPDKVLARSS